MKNLENKQKNPWALNIKDRFLCWNFPNEKKAVSCSALFKEYFTPLYSSSILPANTAFHEVAEPLHNN